MLFLRPFYSSKSPEKYIMGSTKILSSATVFNSENNNKFSILE